MPENKDPSVSKTITEHIEGLGGWRGEMLKKLRKLIGAADPDLTEEWKWGTPVWSKKSNVVAVGAFKDHVKLNFFKGAKLEDPDGLFNSGLDAKTTRTIDLHEGDQIDEKALTRLVRAASELDSAKKK